MLRTIDRSQRTARPGRRDRFRLVRTTGHRLVDLELYGIADGRRPVADAQRFLSFSAMRDQVRPALNTPRGTALADDKWVLAQLLDGFGLPVPEHLGLFEPVHGTTWDGRRRLQTVEQVLAEVADRRPGGLVLKPVGGGQGNGLVILDELDHDTGRAVTRTGQRTTLQRVLAGLDPAAVRGVTGHLVQEPLHSHPALSALAPGTTSPVRVVTLVTLDGQAHVVVASTALGRSGQMASNWHQGGVNVIIDAATGVMGSGAAPRAREWVEHHPDSGQRFTGVQVPWWPEVLEVCRRAALLVPGARAIGWDVVVTADGPVLLEANPGWDLAGEQVHSDGWLADPVVWPLFLAAGAPQPRRGAGAVRRRLYRSVRGRARSLLR